MKIRIAIVDDNYFLTRVIEEKLSFFDDLVLKFTAVNGKDLLQKLEKDALVDLILMDIEMPQMNGIAATTEVKNRYPQIKVVMLTVFDTDENVFNSIKAGADGYLLKEIDPQGLYNGIKETLEGGAAMTPSIALKTLKLLRNPISFEIQQEEKEKIELSAREIDVLEQLSKGLSYTVIAENLIISPSTVRKHTENIYKKLQVHNKLEAIQKAKDNKLI
ncbi:MAG: response regulator transcription factor [Weeksellaceae bacterium]|nr:response regulator transcription factor [Weeksellaceae bacterium]